jgi:transposase-like protein
MANANWIESLNKLTFVELVARFPTDATAIEFLEAIRWQNGASCFRCGCADVSRVKTKRQRPIWYCTGCKQQFTITTGTIMEDTKLPLNKWLMAIHLMCASKKGISSLQLHRMLGITRRSAWHLSHRIRQAMTDMVAPVLRGTVEVDEAYIGGKARGKGQGYRRNKTAIIAMVERDGRARTHVMPESYVTSDVTDKLLEKHIDADATLNTDESHLYTGIGASFDRHDTVNHRDKEYSRWVNGRRKSTNTVEGYFGNLKRQVDGTHHHVSAHHLHRYVSEFEFKYNSRKDTDGQRTVQTTARIEGRRLTLFKNTIGAPSLQD